MRSSSSLSSYAPRARYQQIPRTCSRACPFNAKYPSKLVHVLAAKVCTTMCAHVCGLRGSSSSMEWLLVVGVCGRMRMNKHTQACATQPHRSCKYSCAYRRLPTLPRTVRRRRRRRRAQRPIYVRHRWLADHSSSSVQQL